MGNPALRLVTPTGEIPTAQTPHRRSNKHYRTREHLTEADVERLIEATTNHRDATMILLDEYTTPYLRFPVDEDGRDAWNRRRSSV